MIYNQAEWQAAYEDALDAGVSKRAAIDYADEYCRANTDWGLVADIYGDDDA